MKIKEVMARPVFVLPDSTKKELLNTARKNKDAEIFIVAGKDKKFLGDITIADLFLMLLPNQKFEEIGVQLAFDLEKKFFAKTAKELMRRHEFRCSPDDDVLKVATRLAGIEIDQMPVINKSGMVVGVVTEGIIVRKLKQND
ncbi:MAG TPA: CBS domain-containing protein [Candidatus Nanoarchaeia archaeon]|nr:CBS domain-containing protein [Candidatus Nanoarchaeia archaeon]